MPKMDSKEISIEQINKLDATAFRMLYKTYYKALVCYSIRITGESGAAEDIVQELFSTIWEKQMSFKSLVSFKAYLYNSVRNASIIISSIRMLNLIICKRLSNHIRHTESEMRKKMISSQRRSFVNFL